MGFICFSALPPSCPSIVPTSTCHSFVLVSWSLAILLGFFQSLNAGHSAGSRWVSEKAGHLLCCLEGFSSADLRLRDSSLGCTHSMDDPHRRRSSFPSQCRRSLASLSCFLRTSVCSPCLSVLARGRPDAVGPRAGSSWLFQTPGLRAAGSLPRLALPLLCAFRLSFALLFILGSRT